LSPQGETNHSRVYNKLPYWPETLRYVGRFPQLIRHQTLPFLTVHVIWLHANET
jgi:hypothetical protein